MRIKLKDGSIFNAPDGLSKVEYRDLLLKERPDLYQLSDNPIDVAGDAVERFLGQSKAALVDVLPAIADDLMGDQEGYQKQMGEYAQKLQDLELRAPRRYDSYEDVNGVGDAALYGIEAMSEAAPQLGVQLGAAGLGALAGSVVPGVGTAAGAVTAGALASAILNSPEILNAVTDPSTGKVNYGAGAMALAGVTALDMVGLGEVGGPVLKKAILGKALEKAGMEAGDAFLMRAGKGFLRGALAEAPTEGAQQAIENAAQSYVQQNGDLFSADSLSSIADSMIRGGLGGGIAGGAIDASFGQRPENQFNTALQRESGFSSALQGALDVIPEIQGLQDELNKRHTAEADANRQMRDIQATSAMREAEMQRQKQTALDARSQQLAGGVSSYLNSLNGAQPGTPPVKTPIETKLEKVRRLVQDNNGSKEERAARIREAQMLALEHQRNIENQAAAATQYGLGAYLDKMGVSEAGISPHKTTVAKDASGKVVARTTPHLIPEGTALEQILAGVRSRVDQVNAEKTKNTEVSVSPKETPNAAVEDVDTKTKFSFPPKKIEDVIESATPEERKSIDQLSNDDIGKKIDELKARYEQRVAEVDEQHIKPLEKKHGDIGKEWADGLRDAIRSGKYDNRKLARAFTISHLLNTLPKDSPYSLRLVGSIKPTAAEAAAVKRSSGKEFTEDMEAGGKYDSLSDKALKGLFQISLSDNISDEVTETSAHEFFHAMQDYFEAADPKAAKALKTEIGGKDQTVNFDGLSKRVQNLVKSVGAEEKIKAKGDISGDEMQAYIYGAYANALLNGERVGLQKPGLARAWNFIGDMRQRAKNWANGAGFKTAEDIFSDVVSGKKAKELEGKSPAKKKAEKFSIDNEEGKKWFGNSKAVNADGTPKRYYHGTGKKFDEFKKGKSAYGSIFFTPDEDFANQFAESDHASGGGGRTRKSGQVVYPVYIKAERPFDYEKPEEWEADFSKYLQKKLAAESNMDFGQIDQLVKRSVKWAKAGSWNTVESKWFNDYIKDRGYDSFYVKEGGVKNLAILDPKQAKSVFNEFKEGAADSPKFSIAAPKNSKEFDNWFDNSAVVDENGEPLVVFHGTMSNFNQFDQSHLGKETRALSAKLGFFFSGNPNISSSYTVKPNPYQNLWYSRKDGSWYERANEAALNMFGKTAYRPGGNVMPVFLSIQNPYVVDYKGGDYSDIPFSKTINEARALGHDGVIMKNARDPGYSEKLTGISDEDAEAAANIYVVFDANQVKSAIGNSGEYSKDNPDIRFSVPSGISEINVPAFLSTNPEFAMPVYGSTAIVRKELNKFLGKAFNAEQTDTGYGWGFMDSWLTAMQNHFRPVHKMVESIEERTGKKLADSENPVNAEVRYHGKTGNAIKQAKEVDFKPILQFLKNNNIDWADFDKYLYAQHARERNEYLRSKGSKAVDPSGMSDKEAADIISKLRTPRMEEAARMVYKLLKKTNQLRVESGLLPKSFLNPAAHNAATGDNLPVYQRYVPLRGWEDDPETEDASMNAGQGFNINGKEIKSATGRNSKAANILAHVMMQHVEAIIRAEKNQVGNAMLKMVLNNPVPGVSVNEYETKPAVVNGKIVYRAQLPSLFDKESVFATKKDGKLYIMEFADKRTARALNNSGREALNPLFKAMSKISRYMASINTMFSPEFVIFNFARDIQTAALNLSQYDLDKIRMQTIRDVGKAFKAISHAEGAQFWKAFGSPDQKWVGYYKDFLADGASTEFLGLQTIEDMKDEMSKLVEDYNNKSSLSKAKHALQYVGSLFERHNSAIENATRLSVYVNAIKAGMTREKAAEIAKEITINFNRKGEYGPVMNAAYVFYNAAVQGNAALVRGIIKNKKFRRMMGSVVVMGMMNDLVNRMVAGEDDKGENLWDKLPDYMKQRNFIMMNPYTGNVMFQFPMPYGFNAFWNAGRYAGAAVSGSMSPGTALLNTFTSYVDAFNPLGNGDLLTIATPTLIDPWVESAMNKNFAGAPIMPEGNPFGPQTPDAYKFFNSTSPLFTKTAEWLNKLTGGTEVRSGLIDVSPETLEYALDYLTGATGATVMRSAELARKLVAGDWEDLEWNDVPLARKLFASIPKNVDQQEYAQMRDDVMLAKQGIDQARKQRDHEKIKSIMAEEREKLTISRTFQSIDRRLSDLRNQIKNIDYNKAIPDVIKAERKKAIREQMDRLRTQAMKVYLQRIPEGKRVNS